MTDKIDERSNALTVRLWRLEKKSVDEKSIKTAEELRKENKKPLLEKLKNWLNWIFKPFKFLWELVIKSRVFLVITTFLSGSFGLMPFIGTFFVGDTDKYWEIFICMLRDYPTIALAIASLPIALTLWLFRNHDIVLNLDLDKYHEAVRNIHNKDASVGLRQVAFTTLMELRGKWMWEEKIKTVVFPGANLSKLDLREIHLEEDSREYYEFTEL